jgi:hypothetical protein
MFRKTLSVLLFILASFSTKSQVRYAELDLGTNIAEDFKMFDAGDSVLLMFEQRNQNGAQPEDKTYWVKNNGEVRQTKSPEYPELKFIGISNNAEGNSFLYLGPSKNGFSLSIDQWSTGGKIVNKRAHFRGDFIGMKLSPNPLVLSYNFADDELLVTEFFGIEKKRETKLLMPKDLRFGISPLLKKSVFIRSQVFTTVKEGSASVKFFTDVDALFLVYDRDGAGKAYTHILRLTLGSGEMKRLDILGPKTENFSSYYHRGNIYRFLKGQAKTFASIEIYDGGTGESVYTQKFNRDDAKLNRESVLRHGGERIVGFIDGGEVFRAGTPAIIVEPTDSADIDRIVIGAFYEANGSPIAVGPNPIVMLATLVISTGIAGLTEGPGMSKYFYFTGNRNKRFRIEKANAENSQFIRHQIDIHESENYNADELKRRGMQLRSKAYLETSRGVLAVYQERIGHNKKLMLLKFK